MTSRRVAVCCDDLSLTADARRLCAAAGLDVEVTATSDCSRWWPVAEAVIVDATAAAGLVGRVPRRSRVALLTRLDDTMAWRLAVDLGAEQVALVPGDDERRLLAGVLSVDRSGAAPPLIACLPATGGAGASTVAVGVAAAAARSGRSTLLVDGDPAGGGLDLLFGAETAAGARWPDVVPDGAEASSSTAIDAFVRPLPSLHLLSFDRRGVSVDLAVALPALLRGAGPVVDVVVLDLPRGSDLPRQLRAEVTLLVARADVRSAVASTAAAEALRDGCGDLRLVVRASPAGTLAAERVAAATGLPLAMQLPHDRRILSGADDGQLVRALGRHGFAQLVSWVPSAPSGRAA